MGRVVQMQAINLRNITTVESVLIELESLKKHLPETTCKNLATFNDAYYIVTSVIKAATDAHRFKNPKTIEAFSVCFANYYFQAINDFSDASSTIAPAWKKAIVSADNQRRPAFISLLMGANAHINYDLPFALLSIIEKNEKASLLRDLTVIDKLLIKGGKEILGTFDEPNRTLNFMKRKAQFLYFKPIMYMILWWRVMAWRNYRALENDPDNTNNILKRSTKIAHRLSWLGVHLVRPNRD